MGSGRERVGFGNPGPRTRIPRQLIGGNADELPERTENEGRVLGELVSPSKLPPIPTPIGPGADGGTGGSPNRGTPSRGRIPPKNTCQTRRSSEEGLLRRSAPSAVGHPPPIGELADSRGGMAPDFQSATDRSDRRRLRIRDHPRARGDLPPYLGLVEPADRRPTAERCVELGGGRDNRR